MGGLNTKPLSSTAVFDGKHARAGFPGLQQTMNGKPLVFLDSAASAQKPQIVIDAMVAAMTGNYANVHRGMYKFSQDMTTQFEAARATIAHFMNAQSEETIFTRNATEAINIVAACWGSANLQPGDEIVITALEHHANIVPWQMIAQKTGAKLVVAPITPDGDVLVEDVVACFSARTKMVAISQMSNALGTIVPVQEIVAVAKQRGITTLIDGSQAVVHGPVDVKQLDCDFYVWTGHKLYGPTGIGVLYARSDLLNAMPPYQGGGDMIERVTYESSTYRTGPARFEAGTPAFVEAVGLAAAVTYVQQWGMDMIAAYEREIYQSAFMRLSAVEGVTMHGRAQQRAGILCFTAAWGHPSDIAMILDKEGVAVRVGHHCAMPLMERLGVTGTVRASIALYNTHEDSDAFLAALAKAKRMLG